tara:strand:+ start:1786 stop:2751 length:966 start_codon:yes stop_codon:yes gene_type:complete
MAFSVGKAIRGLKDNFAKNYFLTGDDYFLQSFFIKTLKKKCGDDFTLHHLNFEEENDVNSFINEISSLSLFSSKRIFINRNLNKVSKVNKDHILKYLNNPSNDKIVVFVSDDFYSKNKFFKSISMKSLTVDTRTPFPKKIKEWVRFYLNSNNISINSSILDDLVSSNNDEIMTILNEVEKLYLINECKNILVDENQHTSKNQKNIRPWQFIDSLGKKNNIISINNFEYLQYQGYQLVPLVIIMYNFFNDLILFKNGDKNLFSINKIINNNMTIYSNKYTEKEIINIIISLRDMDLKIKSSSLNHHSLISIFITKICEGYYG